MPYINIKLAGTLNRDQKETIAKEITTLMEKVATNRRLIHTLCLMKLKERIGL